MRDSFNLKVNELLNKNHEFQCLSNIGKALQGKLVELPEVFTVEILRNFKYVPVTMENADYFFNFIFVTCKYFDFL